MSTGRGALLVFEGCDRAGKSTQVKMLVEALNKLNVRAEARSFPNRKTCIGTVLDNFLSKRNDYPIETAHLLFSANRWECKEEMLKTLQSGTTLIVDRYAGSGAVYTAAASGRSLNWCKEADRGLPRPDMVIFLKVSEESQQARSNWGNERYENTKMQNLVMSNYEKLMDSTWNMVDADQEKSVVHSVVLEKALAIVEKVKHLPIGRLYES